MTELERLSEVQNESQSIGEFLEWMGEHGLARCKWHEAKKDWIEGVMGNEIFVEVEPAGFYPDTGSIEKLLAEYFGIDLTKVEKEKRALLEDLQNTG